VHPNNKLMFFDSPSPSPSHPPFRHLELIFRCSVSSYNVNPSRLTNRTLAIGVRLTSTKEHWEIDSYTEYSLLVLEIGYTEYSLLVLEIGYTEYSLLVLTGRVLYFF